ncbi:MAG: beta-hydroxyacyl-ACP dehydratase [Oscillospiraceae bacterium]|nr:beta-hydroxyacyl-ACP dehydratase [Oscillospiraceae bacterium]
MTQEEIKGILPHRDNMLLLDSLERDGEYACGRLKITGSEWFLQGHFPGFPVVPGVILCEILAQSACILIPRIDSAEQIPLYTGLDKVRFKSPVYPGDEFTTRCRLTRSKHPFYFGEGEGYVDGRLCVKASFSFAITEKSVCFQRS